MENSINISAMRYFLAILAYKLYSFLCSILNSRYYYHSKISKSVIFSASYPGLVKIINPEKCCIGKNSVINAGSILHCVGGLDIGDNVHIGGGLCIYTSNHNYRSPKMIPYDNEDILRSVTIGRNVWIGANVTILPGVIIGEGAVVGAASVVVRNVPSCAVVVGNPAKVINYRSYADYIRLSSCAQDF